MKTLITSVLLLAFLDISFQGYVPQPVCRKVPKEICEQVPKTTYDTVNGRECHDIADSVCADFQERKCQISQRPVQDSVSRQQCSLQYRIVRLPMTLRRDVSRSSKRNATASPR